MNSHNRAIFNESVLLERNSAEFYWLLMNLFPEDAAFWANLKTEEENHAKLLLKSSYDLNKMGFFPVEGLEPDLEKIQKTNSIIEEFIRVYKQKLPSLEDAFKIALMLEGTSVEHYFRLSLGISPARTTAVGLLRSLTENEMNHAKRITDRIMRSVHLAKQKNDLKKKERINRSITDIKEVPPE